MELTKIPPSDMEIAVDSFRIFRHLQKKYYKNIMKTYRVWMRISSVLIVICFIIYSFTQQRVFLWVSAAYLITGIISSFVTNIVREMYHRYYRLEASDDVLATALDTSMCKRKNRYVIYGGRKYLRVGCKIENRSPGFILVSCDDYSYIVEVTEYSPKDLLLA